MATSAAALKKMREICLALPGTSEGDHHGDTVFRVGRRIFASCGEKSGTCLLILQLEPDHATKLTTDDPRFKLYTRQKDCVEIDAAIVKGWSEIKLLVLESYRLNENSIAAKPSATKTAKKPVKETPTKKRSPEKKSTKTAGKKPKTIAAYIQAAPSEGRPHLRRLYEILKSVVPEAAEAIKWGTPFFIEPRFLFAFSAHKAHLDFAPMETGLAPFRKELEQYKSTKNFLQVRYDEPLPEELIRRIAELRAAAVRERDDDSFW